MPRYFMHLRDGGDELLDPEGAEFTDINLLRRRALECARDLMAADVRGGRVDLRSRIEVENEAGEQVYCLPFTDAVEIVSPD